MSELQASPAAPPLAAGNFDDVLTDADIMLGAMASRSLPAVAQLAEALCLRARGAGATKISEAADRIREAACCHDHVALTWPMRQLAEAISEERRIRQAEHV